MEAYEGNKVEKNNYDTKKVDKFNLSLSIGIVTILSIQTFVNYGVSYGITSTIVGLSFLTIDIIAYFLKMHKSVKNFIIGSMATYVGFVMSYITKGEPKIFLIYFIALMMIGLYFRKKLILAYGVFFNIAYPIFFY